MVTTTTRAKTRRLTRGFASDSATMGRLAPLARYCQPLTCPFDKRYPMEVAEGRVRRNEAGCRPILSRFSLARRSKRNQSYYFVFDRCYLQRSCLRNRQGEYKRVHSCTDTSTNQSPGRLHVQCKSKMAGLVTLIAMAHYSVEAPQPRSLCEAT